MTKMDRNARTGRTRRRRTNLSYNLTRRKENASSDNLRNKRNRREFRRSFKWLRCKRYRDSRELSNRLNSLIKPILHIINRRSKINRKHRLWSRMILKTVMDNRIKLTQMTLTLGSMMMVRNRTRSSNNSMTTPKKKSLKKCPLNSNRTCPKSKWDSSNSWRWGKERPKRKRKLRKKSTPSLDRRNYWGNKRNSGSLPNKRLRCSNSSNSSNRRAGEWRKRTMMNPGPPWCNRN